MKKIACIALRNSFIIQISITLGIIFSNSCISSQWIQQTTGTLAILNSIDAVHGTQTVFAAGDNGTILKTTNRGINWTALSSGTGQNLVCIKFRDVNTGYAGGQNGTLLRTTNGGGNWNALSFGSSTQTVYGIDMYPTTVVFIATNEGEVYRSSNSGDNFTMLADLSPGSFYTIECLGPGFISSGGDLGILFKSTNNGDNWTGIPLPVQDQARDVGFADLSTGYCISSSKVFKTTNGGTNWTEQFTFPPVVTSLYYYRFSGADTVYICGLSGRIFKTTNSGENWFQQASGTGDILLGITGVSNRELWVCGSSGKILHTTNGGGNFIMALSQSQSRHPDEFSLSQNYPNPFNPSTKIEFRIASASRVKLEIFNASGEQIQCDVYEYLEAGIYSFEFNASVLPSGIYFYRLQAGSYSGTGKMILLK